MIRRISAFGFVLFVASVASLTHGQTIYAPVQYQYGDGANRYYYGGSDPAVFAMADRQRCLDDLMDHPFTSERYTNAYIHRRLIGQLDRVYSDCVPYMNARVYGYLQVDAANEAYANVPRYFRKADLVASADVQPDGSRVVAPHAQPVVASDRAADRAGATTMPKPRAIIIIPKKAKTTSDKPQQARAE